MGFSGGVLPASAALLVRQCGPPTHQNNTVCPASVSCVFLRALLTQSAHVIVDPSLPPSLPPSSPVQVLLLTMLSPRSYTCEDMVELHCHGGSTCVQRVMRAVIEAGARAARPGEFTLRAFLNGQLDLTQASWLVRRKEGGG